MSYPSIYIVTPEALKAETLEVFYGIGGSQHEREHGLTMRFTSDGTTVTHWGTSFSDQNQNGPRIAQLQSGQLSNPPADLDQDLVAGAMANYVVHTEIGEVDGAKINIFIGISGNAVLEAMGLQKWPLPEA